MHCYNVFVFSEMYYSTAAPCRDTQAPVWNTQMESILLDVGEERNLEEVVFKIYF